MESQRSNVLVGSVRISSLRNGTIPNYTFYKRIFFQITLIGVFMENLEKGIGRTKITLQILNQQMIWLG